MSIEMQLETWRQKCRDRTITKDELKEAIKALREDRLAAVSRSKKARKPKSTSTPLDSSVIDDLFGA